MTKISNYTIKNPIEDADYWIGTAGNTSGKTTKNFKASDVRDYVKAGLTPVDGGTLKITETIIDTLDTDVATTVNAIYPAYTVLAYEQMWFYIEDALYVLKLTNLTIGVGGTTLTNEDFIAIPVSVGPAGPTGPTGPTGNGILDIENIGTVGLVKTYRITFTDASTFDYDVTDGANGSNGVNANMTRTSTDSIAISPSGSKTLTYTASTNLGWAIGTRLRFWHDANSYMEGQITAVSSTSVTINVDYKVGSGTYATWNISVTGDKGSVGVYPDLVAELFSDEIYEYTGGANTIVGSVASGVTFSLYFKKVGNNVFITGFITNGSGSTIGSSTVLLTITNDAYKLKVGTGHDFVASRTSDLTTTIVNASIMDTSGNIRCSIGSLTSGNSLTLRGRYTVNTP